MTFKDVKIGTILYEVTTRKSQFNLIERVVDKVEHTEKKTIISLCPKAGCKDWIYHVYDNKTMFVSRQQHPIFIRKYDAYSYLQAKIDMELSYLNKQRFYIERLKERINKALAEQINISKFQESFIDYWAGIDAREKVMSYEEFVSRYYIQASNPVIQGTTPMLLTPDIFF